MTTHQLMRLVRAVPNPRHDGRSKHSLAAVKSFPQGKLMHLWPEGREQALLIVDGRVMPSDVRDLLLAAAEQVVAPADKDEVMAFHQLDEQPHDADVLEALLASGAITLAQLDIACAIVAQRLERD
jgi:hypothetical protein